MDWKEQLGAAFGLDSAAAVDDSSQDDSVAVASADARQRQGSRAVHVLVERKGRAGRVATLIVDLCCDEAALKRLAGELKQQLGVGGSARAGEILIQGDHRQRVTQLLRERGFKVK